MASKELERVKELYAKIPKQLGMTGFTTDFHSVVISSEVDEQITPVMNAGVARWVAASDPVGRVQATAENQKSHEDLFNLVTFLCEVANNWEAIEREIHQAGWQEGWDECWDENV